MQTKGAQARVGILGGGQLGRMLLQAAVNYPVETYVMENDDHCPSAHLCNHFTKGDIRDNEAVYEFGKGLDALTIEIENVNVEALEKLEQEGVRIFPKPSVLRTIKNKVFQKLYYQQHQIPTPEFRITSGLADLHDNVDFLPAVHKIAEGGYDGKGVVVLKEEIDIPGGFESAAVLEKFVTISKEIALVIAVDEVGSTAIYPAVEMLFDPHLNLLDYQMCPADLDKQALRKAEAIALSVVKNFNSPGIFAVELLVDDKGEILVNETAPRVHNSGHHTIEAHFCSQFDMLWRIILRYPLGSTAAISPSIMINILGANDHSGDVRYEGLEEVLAIENAFVHLYGKKQTKPGRKMGHVTVLSNEKQELLLQSNKIKRTLLPKT